MVVTVYCFWNGGRPAGGGLCNWRSQHLGEGGEGGRGSGCGAPRWPAGGREMGPGGIAGGGEGAAAAGSGSGGRRRRAALTAPGGR